MIFLGTRDLNNTNTNRKHGSNNTTVVTAATFPAPAAARNLTSHPPVYTSQQPCAAGFLPHFLTSENHSSLPLHSWASQHGQSQAQHILPAFPFHAGSTVPGTFTTTYSSLRLTVLGTQKVVSSLSQEIIKQGASCLLSSIRGLDGWLSAHLNQT